MDSVYRMLKANPSLHETFVDIFSYPGDIIPENAILKGIKSADKMLLCKLLKVYSLVEIRTNNIETEFFIKKTNFGVSVFEEFIEAEAKLA